MSDPGIDAWFAALPLDERVRRRRNMMSITPVQAEIALIQAGLMPQVEAALAQADAVTQAAWRRATEFRRTSPTLQAMAQALGLSDEQLDALFDAAALIEV